MNQFVVVMVIIATLMIIWVLGSGSNIFVIFDPLPVDFRFHLSFRKVEFEPNKVKMKKEQLLVKQLVEHFGSLVESELRFLFLGRLEYTFVNLVYLRNVSISARRMARVILRLSTVRFLISYEALKLMSYRIQNIV